MRKDGILSVGIDTQLVEHSMHSPPLHLKTSDSALSQKSKAESNITQCKCLAKLLIFFHERKNFQQFQNYEKSNIFYLKVRWVVIKP